MEGYSCGLSHYYRVDGGVEGPVRVWATGPTDESPEHVSYPRGYDPACSWCWLNITHTNDEHVRQVTAS